MGQDPKLDSFLAPLLFLLYPVPKVVLLPVIVVLFGLGDFPKVLLITLIVFFQLAIVTRDAAKQLPEQYLLSGRSLGMSPSQLRRRVLLPACLPHAATSLRVGLGTAVSVLFFSETFASVSGLGYYIHDAMSQRDYPKMYAGILALALLGFLLYLLLSLLERRVSRWRRPQRADHSAAA
jgi:NitT/TauT family transport system permease protein